MSMDTPTHCWAIPDHRLAASIVGPGMHSQQPEPLSTSESIRCMPANTPISPPLSSASSPPDSDLDEELSKDKHPVISFSPCELDVSQQASLWSYALRQKKTAKENLLKAQMILESLEEVFAQRLPAETIEGARARFLSGIRPTTTPEAHYLLTIGRLNIRPSLPHPSVPSRSYPSLAHAKSAQGNSAVLPMGHVRPSHTQMAACRDGR